MDQMDFDEERYQYVSNRLDTLNTLKKKYGPTLEDVFKFAQKQSELANLKLRFGRRKNSKRIS